MVAAVIRTFADFTVLTRIVWITDTIAIFGTDTMDVALLFALLDLTLLAMPAFIAHTFTFDAVAIVTAVVGTNLLRAIWTTEECITNALPLPANSFRLIAIFWAATFVSRQKYQTGVAAIDTWM